MGAVCVVGHSRSISKTRLRLPAACFHPKLLFALQADGHEQHQPRVGNLHCSLSGARFDTCLGAELKLGEPSPKALWDAVAQWPTVLRRGCPLELVRE